MSVNRLETGQLETLWGESGYDLPDDKRHNLNLDAPSTPSQVEQVEQFVADHPKTLVIAALALGLVFGWLGKRK